MVLEGEFMTSLLPSINHSCWKCHAAYQIELENLEAVLETNTFLMDRLTGQFRAVYEDSYRQMATIPKLLHPW